jgi:diguanylate cyclase (GGDEF)-like protein/PAS domain S-box-containing protein
MFSTRNGRIAWLVAVGAAGMLGWTLLVRERDYAASHAAIAQTFAVQRSIGETMSLLKDAETGQRGFLLTGNEAYLAPYERARILLPAQLQELRQSLRGDLDELRSVEEIARLSLEKLEELAYTVRLGRTDEADAAREMVREGKGRQLMLALRDKTQKMLDRQQSALAQREAAGMAERRQLAAILIGIAAFIALLLASGYWSAVRGMAEAKRAAQRLAEGQQALRSLADNATDLVRIIGERAQLLYVSPSCQRILGYTQEEMLVMGPRALMHEDEREQARELTEQIRAGTAPLAPFVHRLRGKDGAYRWFETTYCLSKEGERPTDNVQLTSRDITERRRAEQELRHQTTRLQSILASMGDGVVVLDQDRRLLVVNPTARAYFRQEEGQQVAKDWSKDLHTYLPDGKTLFPSDHGPLTRALRGQACDGIELVIQDRAGAARAFSVTSRPIVVSGEPAGCVAIYHDITEQRRAERELAESEHRLRVLSESTFEGIAITRGGKILDSNPLFASWFGRTPAELVGLAGLELFAPEDRERVLSQSAQSASCYDAHMLHADGSRFPVEVRGRDATFRGESARIAVIRDITEQRRQEAALKAQAQQLEALSLRDDLTGLYNRRGFQEHGQRQLANAARSRRPACVFFIDLNGMKGINDTHGHEVGDRALVMAAKVLSSVFRASDVVARLGGDEFAIFAQECSLDDVPTIRARISDRVDALNISGGERFHLSLSVGAACLDAAQPADLDGLLEAADHSMYEEKRAQSSRTRVAAADESGEPLAALRALR